MPIDVGTVLQTRLPTVRGAWTPDDVILYQLGLGAGVPPTDASELAYTYEGALKILPSWGVIPVMDSLLAMLSMPGMEIDATQVLHGEQDLRIHDTLPAQAEVVTEARVTDVFDKGKAALVILEAVTANAADGRPLFTNRISTFIRGEGGFGGESGPRPGNLPPDRAPDHAVACPTLPQQALIYRLSGDKNPLHADPAFAQRGGFDRPILHGLCTYGIACKAVVDAALGGDVERIGRYEARFAGIVFPGETVNVSMWQEPDRIVLSAHCPERDTPVLSNAAITLR